MDNLIITGLFLGLAKLFVSINRIEKMLRISNASQSHVESFEKRLYDLEIKVDELLNMMRRERDNERELQLIDMSITEK